MPWLTSPLLARLPTEILAGRRFPTALSSPARNVPIRMRAAFGRAHRRRQRSAGVSGNRPWDTGGMATRDKVHRLVDVVPEARVAAIGEVLRTAIEVGMTDHDHR